MSINLNSEWKVRSIDYSSNMEEVLRENFLPQGWLSAQIPEEIHATLRRAGVLRGNTYDKREDEEKWVEMCDWLYYKAFYLSPEDPRDFLIFEGLDTFAEIYINGKYAGSHRNMFTPCRLDVRDLLQACRRNVILIRFRSPVLSVQSMDNQDIFSITTSERMYARKAQMNYSWDFCGRCVTVGIWKSVHLEQKRTEGNIQDYYLQTLDASSRSATVQIEATLTLPSKVVEYTLSASLTRGDKTTAAKITTTDGKNTLTLRLEDPDLWWPRPYGAQPLYQFNLLLLENGIPVDRKAQLYGIRRLELLQEKQPDGVSFQFCVNGRKLFMRGANWVPLNTIYTDISDRDYETLVEYAVRGNISMLRIWGGGIYENDILYQLCDREGILLWNDFMFSCGIYPHDPDFLSEVREEAEYILRHYRNYTCLAVWSADNEVGQSYIWAGREYEFDLDPINHRILKEACAQLDPGRFYMITSPCSPNPQLCGGDNQESPYQGDMHLYIMSADRGIRSSRDYGRDYYKRVLGYRPRFISEFGFISLPGRESYLRFNPRMEPLRNPSEIIKFLPFTKELLNEKDTDRLIYYSQVFNASALKYWIEYFRSLKGTCSGTLYWKFNDPLADCPDAWMFPSHMCSVDMYHRTKMSYDYTRRAYADILVAFVECLEDYPGVHVCNETLHPVSGELTVTRRTFSGDMLEERSVKCTADPDCAMLALRLDDKIMHPEDPYNEYLKAEWKTNEGTFENRYFFADLNEINRLALPEGRIRISGCLNGPDLALRIEADAYLRNLTLSVPDETVFFSDNRFDMDTDSIREIHATVKTEKDLRSLALLTEAENLKPVVIPLLAFIS